MNKMRNWIVGLTLVSLLAFGSVAVAGNGFRSRGDCDQQRADAGSCDLRQQDADGDGIPHIGGGLLFRLGRIAYFDLVATLNTIGVPWLSIGVLIFF